MDDRFAIINILSFNPHTMSNLTKNDFFPSKGLLCKSLRGKEKILDPFKEGALKTNWFHRRWGKNLTMKTMWLQNKTLMNTTKLS